MGYGNPPGLSVPKEKKDELAPNTHGTIEAAPGTTHGANGSVVDLTPNTFMPGDDTNHILSGYMDSDFLTYPKTDTTNLLGGCSTSTLSPFDNFFPQDVALLRSPQKVDGLNSNFSTLNRQNANNPFSVAGTSSSAAGIQNSADGIVTENARLNPFAVHGLQAPQVDERSRFLVTSDNSQSDRFPYWNAPVSYTEHLNSSINPYPAYFASQSNFNQQHNLYGLHGNSSVPFSVESSSNSFYDSHMGMPFVNPRLGNLTPLPRGVQPVGKLYPRQNVVSASVNQISLFPPGFTFPVAQGNGFQSSLGRPFTARPPQGLPSIPLAAPINPIRPLATGKHQHGIRPPFSMAQRVTPFPSFPRLNIGGPQSSPGLYHQSLQRPATSSERRRAIPKPFPYKQPKPRQSQRAQAPVPATKNSPFATSSQRRRAIPKPFPYQQPKPRQSQRSQAPVPTTTPIPSTPFHIKWQGFDELPPPSGRKCRLCKRDVSCTAEGQIYQPTMPPAVAILPCGHIFHDQCLQRITPKDQSKNPPCIPCAIGET